VLGLCGGALGRELHGAVGAQEGRGGEAKSVREAAEAAVECMLPKYDQCASGASVGSGHCEREIRISMLSQVQQEKRRNN
jgi:hypothetical protein